MEAIGRLREIVTRVGNEHIDPRSLKALWQLSISIGDWRTGLAAGMIAAQRDPMDARFSNDVVQSLARCPAEALPPAELVKLPSPSALPSLSVILVSRDDARHAAVSAEYDRAFAHWPHERIRIPDARSMYDGYARGFAASHGELVIFSHDDIRFAVPDFAARLADAFGGADVIGVAGSTQVIGPTLLWAGHPHLFGTVVHHDVGEAAYDFSLASLIGPRIDGAACVDGVFIAARREWIERVGFDPQTFRGFHFYDLDFSYRARLAGARVMIAADLGLIHRSRGRADEQWRIAQRAFAAKFGLERAPAAGKSHWYALQLPDATAVTRAYAKLNAAWRLRLD